LGPDRQGPGEEAYVWLFQREYPVLVSTVAYILDDREAGVPGGYVYEPTWLPEHVRRIAASEEGAGPLVAPGQWSQRIRASETRCPPSCSVLSVHVLRGQPPLDAARQARDYAGRLVTVRGREGVLLPAIAGMRNFAALIWTAPSGLLVVVEGTDAGTPVPEREVLAVAARLRLPAATGGRLGKPSSAGRATRCWPTRKPTSTRRPRPRRRSPAPCGTSSPPPHRLRPRHPYR
jgi:hypothetical protein